MNEPRHIVWAHDTVEKSAVTAGLVGGKALGLHDIAALGLPAPSWATITSALFHTLSTEDEHLKCLLNENTTDPLDKAKKIREYLMGMDIPSNHADLLRRVWREISANGRHAIAARSSAADEDSATLSFAGQMESFLNVRDFEAFLKAVRGCWASLFGERAVVYRIRHNINPWQAQIAIVAQRMIKPSASGVLFTANPLTGNTREMLVSSVWGLGEGLVSGTLDADTFILNSKAELLKSEIVKKDRCVNFGKHGGTSVANVPMARQNAASLTQKHLRMLHAMGLKIQKLKGVPMDIEFGIEKHRIFLLQARPITNLKKHEEFFVWDNSNIVESYSGVTTPLTFSFIRRAYFAVYWQFCRTLGLDEKTIEQNKHVLQNMLGLIYGRVYYNLLNWYRLVSLMPGFKYNKKFMEQMMGLQVIKDFDLGQGQTGFLEKYFVQLPRLAKVSMRMILAHLRLQRAVAGFHKNFNAVYAHYSQLDYSLLSPKELHAIYNDLEKKILWRWKAPITNDFEAMIFYGLLKNLTIKWGLDPMGVLQNDLLCGEGGIKSTQVTTQLFYLTQEIERYAALKALLINATPEEALKLLNTDPSFAAIKAKLDDYLREYGVRCINEMKLESIPIKDNPLFCVSVIQNYLRNTVPDPAKQEAHERAIRRQAETQLKKRLGRQRVFLALRKLTLFRWALNNARRAIKNRENQRFCRTEAYSLIRTIMRAIGRQWHTQGLLNDPEDIFYLEMEEIWRLADGEELPQDIKTLTQERRAEFARYNDIELPDHIETYGEVNLSLLKQEMVEATEQDTLKGLGCCAGTVENEVRVVLTPDVNLRLNGEIMVARQTDPGWVVLFPSISGLIVEKGSMLSHSAIVAREMGIPAVVGVKHATRILASGDRVLLNGANGTVSIIGKARA